VTAPSIGTPAPQFSFLDNEGSRRSLAEFLGTPVVVVFGGAQISAERPIFQELVREGEPVTVVAPDNADVAGLYGVPQQSAVFVVAEDGRVAWRHAADQDAMSAPLPSAVGLSRRAFVATVLAASVAALFSQPVDADAAAALAAPGALDRIDVTLDINGRSHRLTLDPRVTLLDALREHLGLAGSRKGCDHGQCGACTVHVDGRRILSCLTLAAAVQGKAIATIEGVADGSRLHPMQQAFIEQDGFQCGYCTPGQIMSAIALLGEPCGPGDDDVREYMSGNICRCGAYEGIVAAIQSVRGHRS
jgi:xanthine dehydrogenase YagT iron-sulfur-binding subunit